MKKIIITVMTIVMVASLSISALAAGAFVSSPSANEAPELVSGAPVTPECTGTLVISSYADRANLSDEARAKLEEAYNQIANYGAGNAFATVLQHLAGENKLAANQLSVSDLFDISSVNCTHHEKHEGFIITIGVGDLEHFVGILHFTGSVWEELEINDVDEAAHTVTFTTPSLSPFAVVVNNGAEAPAASGNAWIWIVVAAVVVAAAAAAVVVVAKKKRA